jgi:hypothetical protein
MASPFGVYVAGVARTALPTYADGDTAFLTFDAAGRLMVNMGGILVEEDDDSIDAAEDHETIIPLNYGFDGTHWRRQQVKSATAATSDERLMHLSVMAVLAMIDTTAPAGSQEIPLSANRDIGAAAIATGYYLMTRSAITGYDSGAAAGSQSVPIAARAAVTAQAYTLYRALTDAVVRGDDGTTYSAIAARAPGTTPLDERLYGLYSLAFLRALDLSAAAGSQGVGVGAVGSASVSASALASAYGLAVVQARESGYAAAKRGGRFAGCNQTPGTELTTPSTAYDATKPSVMLRINSASIRAVVRRLQFMISTAGGAAPVWYALVLDTADRYSAGGTAITPQNQNEESATPAVALLYETPTATAAGGGTRVIAHGVCANTIGVLVDLDLSDGVLMGHTASTLMLYVWTGTSAVKIVYDAEWEEVP